MPFGQCHGLSPGQSAMFRSKLLEQKHDSRGQWTVTVEEPLVSFIKIRGIKHMVWIILELKVQSIFN